MESVVQPAKNATRRAQPLFLVVVMGLIVALMPPALASGNTVVPLAGDWSGDGVSSPGWFLNGTFVLKRATESGEDLRFTFGRAGDVPVVGDWNNDGRETVGVVRQGRKWFLKNGNESGPADLSFSFGSRFRREVPIVGDWNGDGTTTPGVIRGNRWLLRNSNSGGDAQIDFTYGRISRGDIPVVGAWEGTGRDTPGVVRDGVWYLAHTFEGGDADVKLRYGRKTDTPIAGNWNGRGGDTLGVVRNATWYLKNSLVGGYADSLASFRVPGVSDSQTARSTSKGKESDSSSPRKQEHKPRSSESQASKSNKANAAEKSTTASQSRSDQVSRASSEVAHGTDLTREHVGLSGIGVADLKPSGPIVTSRNGQVIEGLDIEVSGRDNWAIEIRHDNVVVRNNRIRHPNGGQGITSAEDTSGALIEHNVFDAVYLSDVRKGHKSSSNSVGQRTTQIRGDGHVIRRNHVLFARSAFWVRSSNTLIAENWIEPLADEDGVSPTTGTPNSPGGASLHGTAISNGGGTVGWTAARNVVPQGGSGGIIIYSGDAPHRDLTIRDNWFYGTDRGFAIYGGRTHNRSNWEQNRNIKIEGNRFSGTFGYSDVLGRGTNAAVDLSRPGNTFDNNRFIGEDTDLPARCGISRNACE